MPIRLFLALLLACAASAGAQTWPGRPVRVIIPFPPGGAPDLTGRVLAGRLAERLGQPFVVENRTGAGGNIATETVAKSPADGYTLLAGSDGPLVINPNVYVRTGFDTLRDFAPISIATSSGFVLMACPKVPAQTLAELVALAKTRQLSIGSSGFGSNHHLAAEMLKTAAGINLTHVPYKGFGNAVVDAVGCNVDLLFGSIPAGIPHITSGKLRALAVTQPRRHPGLPDTPTFAEANYPSVAMDAYFGMLAPAGTPQPIIDRLYTEIAAILQEKEIRERLSGAGLDIVGGTPEQFKERLRADLARYATVARSLGAKAE